MNDFDLNNNNTEENRGSVSGFDSVNGEPQGYTVSNNGGFYTKHKEDIIQDSPVSEPEPQVKEETYTPPQSSYTSGGYNYNYTPPHRKPKKEKAKRGYSAAVVIVASVLAAVIGAVSAAVVVFRFTADNSSGTSAAKDYSSDKVNISIEETADSVAVAVAQKLKNSVVGIRTTTSVISFFGGSQESTGEGSGVVYTSDGYIITNYHVVESAIEGGASSKIEVFIGDTNGDSHEASVVGYNIASDLAVLKINATGLTPVEIGDSSSLKVGQYVVSIGNPGGLEFMGSVTFGIISGLDREISSSSGVKLIQTDAAINPGNSGGALLDTTGKLVGINSSKIVAEEYEGMGFAIPVNTVVEKCNSIISRENEPEAYVGINISETYTAEVLKYYGFPSGAVVLSVDANSPAQDAGIRKGDIITAFNGTDISDYTVFLDMLRDCEPESKITLEIYRSGRYYTTSLTVGSNN
ncbi:MAG: trypsin-like peptidase domain-containing protein [Clostridia bacterium]|nr:trypsin-like peptidase domain-containing protein [Clostridia bacterium]